MCSSEMGGQWNQFDLKPSYCTSGYIPSVGSWKEGLSVGASHGMSQATDNSAEVNTQTRSG